MKEGKKVRLLKFDDYIITTSYLGQLVQRVPFTYDEHDTGIDEKALCIIDNVRQMNIQQRYESPVCAHCKGNMTVVYERADYEETCPNGETIWQCHACDFWKARNWDLEVHWITPFVKSFLPQRHIAALSALMEETRKDSGKVYTLEARKFELLADFIFRKFYNCEVKHIGKSHDGSIDLFVVASDDPIMVQVKRGIRTDSIEGIDVVKNLFTSVFAQCANYGTVVTTAQPIIKTVRDWIHLPSLYDNSFEIDLVDINRLLDMLKVYKVEDSLPAWNQVIHFYQILYVVGKWGPMQMDNISVKRCRDGFIIEKQSPKDFGTYVIKDSHRDCCWKYNSNDCSSANIEDTDSMIKLISDSTKGLSGIRLITGQAFYELLHSLPNFILKDMVEQWALADKNILVGWQD